MLCARVAAAAGQFNVVIVGNRGVDGRSAGFDTEVVFADAIAGNADVVVIVGNCILAGQLNAGNVAAGKRNQLIVVDQQPGLNAGGTVAVGNGYGAVVGYFARLSHNSRTGRRVVVVNDNLGVFGVIDIAVGRRNTGAALFKLDTAHIDNPARRCCNAGAAFAKNDAAVDAVGNIGGVAENSVRVDAGRTVSRNQNVHVYFTVVFNRTFFSLNTVRSC